MLGQRIGGSTNALPGAIGFSVTSTCIAGAFVLHAYVCKSTQSKWAMAPQNSDIKRETLESLLQAAVLGALGTLARNPQVAEGDKRSLWTCNLECLVPWLTPISVELHTV